MESPSTRLLLVLNTGPCVPGLNMALDEALLNDSARRAAAVLRFYGWTEPAATFGYFQRHADIERLTNLRPLIRRPTGGGLVPHDRDWTYSLAIPPAHPWHALRASESYRAMHAWILQAFGRLEVKTELAASPRKEMPGQCFAGWERFDVLWGGRKIGGAAQRRNRLGLLIQGSIQPPPRLDRGAWEKAMMGTAPEAGLSECQELGLDDRLSSLATALFEAKYSRVDYNSGR